MPCIHGSRPIFRDRETILCAGDILELETLKIENLSSSVATVRLEKPIRVVIRDNENRANDMHLWRSMVHLCRNRESLKSQVIFTDDSVPITLSTCPVLGKVVSHWSQA
ncbi:MAG: hypothetical protein LBB19_02220 [Puniceicoccales bacterium]|nr:hypothetical protein [Puniceicoccales bacterium]